MSTYDRRAKTVLSKRMGTLGVTYEQLSATVREELQLPPGTNVNVQFGAVSSSEREMTVPFTGSAGGRPVSGRVVFQMLEANARQWSGSAILVEGRIEVG